MAEHQIQRHVESLRDYPALWFCVVYAICFFGVSVAIDLRISLLGSGSETSTGWRYLFPLAFPTWLWFGLRGRTGHIPTTDGEPADA